MSENFQEFLLFDPFTKDDRSVSISLKKKMNFIGKRGERKEKIEGRKQQS